MVLDVSVGRQTYIEDCEVCCKPIEISFTVKDDDLASFYAKTGLDVGTVRRMSRLRQLPRAGNKKRRRFVNHEQQQFPLALLRVRHDHALSSFSR